MTFTRFDSSVTAGQYRALAASSNTPVAARVYRELAKIADNDGYAEFWGIADDQDRLHPSRWARGPYGNTLLVFELDDYDMAGPVRCFSKGTPRALRKHGLRPTTVRRRVSGVRADGIAVITCTPVVDGPPFDPDAAIVDAAALTH
ncbi:hypothetical protein [Nocardia tengchongensis]|uniref:hypothetical protein n=1 Tax=Nocardia tengchongensis TaxID=2055889 RepID=UPI00364C402C